mmetsp:Transcript_51855/g.112674  ORF Transcript_51855/g.112674 Transcript_51855/m.112674 type:complete len:206 (+) Transcript_51855:305-922(+)
MRHTSTHSPAHDHIPPVSALFTSSSQVDKRFEFHADAFLDTRDHGKADSHEHQTCSLLTWFKPHGEWKAAQPADESLLYRMFPLIGETKPNGWRYNFIELLRKLVLGFLVGFSTTGSRIKMYAIVLVAVLDVIYIALNRRNISRIPIVSVFELVASMQRLVAVSVVLSSLNGSMSSSNASNTVLFATMSMVLVQVGRITHSVYPS